MPRFQRDQPIRPPPKSGFTEVDYIAVREAETLKVVSRNTGRPLLAAAWLGRTRLIDNVRG